MRLDATNSFGVKNNLDLSVSLLAPSSPRVLYRPVACRADCRLVIAHQRDPIVRTSSGAVLIRHNCTAGIEHKSVRRRID